MIHWIDNKHLIKIQPQSMEKNRNKFESGKKRKWKINKTVHLPTPMMKDVPVRRHKSIYFIFIFIILWCTCYLLLISITTVIHDVPPLGQSLVLSLSFKSVLLFSSINPGTDLLALIRDRPADNAHGPRARPNHRRTLNKFPSDK